MRANFYLQRTLETLENVCNLLKNVGKCRNVEHSIIHYHNALQAEGLQDCFSLIFTDNLCINIAGIIN